MNRRTKKPCYKPFVDENKINERTEEKNTITDNK